MQHSSLGIMFCLVVTCAAVSAENLCPPGVKSDKLICLLPQVYGTNGLILTNSATQFQTNFLTNSLRPLNSALARQSALLPLPSPSSGLSFTWDPAQRVFLSSSASYGPIFGERAQTIGKHRVFLGAGYQYFSFSTLDGISLKRLPEVFTQPDVTIDFGPSIGTQTCSTSSDDTSTGFCSVIRDVITADNRLDLKIHQWATSITYGLTNSIDISAVIPIENVRMGIISSTTIVNNSNSDAHIFPETSTCKFPCRTQVFSDFRTVSGIGDIVLQAKVTAWRGEKAALAVGADVRFPTGDARNFIGAGAYGVKPFVAWSYQSRVISPHVLVGYEANGSSLIAGDITAGTKEKLSSQFTYAGGVEIWTHERLTIAVDVVGQQVFEGRRTSLTSFTELGACTQDFGSCAKPFNAPNKDDDLAQSTETFNLTNMSFGVKVRPFRSKQALAENQIFSTFLITANVLIKMNDGGLRASAVPLVGVSYTF
jgi:hypothetical protein